MTVKQFYENILVEINKVEAPSLLLEDFNYFINKAILAYITTRYPYYDLNQELTDDISVIKGSDILTATIAEDNKLQKATYRTLLPDDYFHLLNCILEFKVVANYKCYTKDELIYKAATRLTSNLYAAILNNYYLKPSFKKPYYYIHNTVDNVPATTGDNIPVIQENVRFKGGAAVNLEIRYGNDVSQFELTRIHIDYIKTPRRVSLTQDELDSDNDTSQVLEFPDYVCMEIIKEMVKLLLENSSDPRLQTNIPVNQTMPTQQGKNR